MNDITKQKHKGNLRSVAANPVDISKSKIKVEIIKLLENPWFHDGKKGWGLSSKEIAELLDRPLHSVSGRLSELKRYGLIEESGKVLDGCAVLQLKKGK